ncbi:gamma-glutamylcyclotransferase [Saccharopolyspora cebuensis]|uniref:Gamma-glutamylcyclotransferase n=1 Tax=Saccharopolyspora cebuensis TaxID=418759 RepID=A0ABV4CDQ3_9PSEU
MSAPRPTPDFHDVEYPADPYPGERPPTSFLHHDEAGYVLVPDATPSGWRLNGTTGRDLDDELAALGAASVQERLPVLAYGSNVNPSKITWMREELGLSGPVIVIQAECQNVAAVWSAGVRQRDGQRPAVIAAWPEIRERHAVLLVTPEQRQVLDRVEGRGERYRLAHVHTPVELDGGRALASVLAYTARPEVVGKNVPIHLNRSPLLVDGKFVRCADVEQAQAILLDGVPADSDGLTATEVHGEP